MSYSMASGNVSFCDVCGCVLYSDEEYMCDECAEDESALERHRRREP